MKKYIIITCLLISTIISSRERTYLIPQSHLYNNRILNVPPIKIEGFILGMTKESFIKIAKKKYPNITLEKRKVRTSSPKIDLYILQLLNEEKMVFYTYNDILTKIYVVYLRPFDSMQRITRVYIYRYGKPKILIGRVSRINNANRYSYKIYSWQNSYRYIPEFLRERIDVEIKVSLDFSLQGSHMRKVVFGYCFGKSFIKLFINR